MAKAATKKTEKAATKKTDELNGAAPSGVIVDEASNDQPDESPSDEGDTIEDNTNREPPDAEKVALLQDAFDAPEYQLLDDGTISLIDEEDTEIVAGSMDYLLWAALIHLMTLKTKKSTRPLKLRDDFTDPLSSTGKPLHINNLDDLKRAFIDIHASTIVEKVVDNYRITVSHMPPQGKKSEYQNEVPLAATKQELLRFYYSAREEFGI